jgi:hypothetical protein
MRKSVESQSCKDLPKSSRDFKVTEKASKPSKIKPIAQAVPSLPESKFFPSSGRNIHVSRASNLVGATVSANISTTNSVNTSGVYLGNLTVRNHSKTESLNFSQHSNERIVENPVRAWTDLQLPTNPACVLRNFSAKLSDFEQSEILRYQHVYCIGIEAKKMKTQPGSLNYGFDDENGDYKGFVKDHVAYRYEILELVGRGSFGQVFKVFDFKHQCHCALKVIRNKPRFQQQAMVEIEILKTLRKKDAESAFNVVHIQSSFQFRNHIVTSN